ncbi:hypothetical protein B0H11DRAFT_2367827 [Mycena galericulata]|nr:hypothetical protein B0H11DRAFT_2367827 [Mycena galericulata]
MVAPRFDDEDDDNLIRFFAHPTRLLQDRNPGFKLLGPEGHFPWSFHHNSAAWKRRSGLIPDFDSRILSAARQRQKAADLGPESSSSSSEEEEQAEEERTPTPPLKPRKLSLAAPKKTPRTVVAKQDDVLDVSVFLIIVVESAGILRQRMEEESSEGEQEEEEEEEAQLKPKLIKVKPAAKKKYAARTPPEYEEDDEEEPVPSTKVKAVVKAPRKAPVGKPASKATKPTTTEYMLFVSPPAHLRTPTAAIQPPSWPSPNQEVAITPAPPKPPQKAAAKPVFKPVVEVVMKKRKKNFEDSPDDEVRPKKKRSAYHPHVALTPEPDEGDLQPLPHANPGVSEAAIPVQVFYGARSALEPSA